MRDECALPLLAGIPESERFEAWHLALPDRRVVGAGAGGAELLCSMALTRPAGRALARIPRRALEVAYEGVARHRARLGRVVPDGPGPRRYP